jgi:hypothetical protein
MTFHLVDAIDEVIDLALEESIPIEDGVSLTV